LFFLGNDFENSFDVNIRIDFSLLACGGKFHSRQNCRYACSGQFATIKFVWSHIWTLVQLPKQRCEIYFWHLVFL